MMEQKGSADSLSSFIDKSMGTVERFTSRMCNSLATLDSYVMIH